MNLNPFKKKLEDDEPVEETTRKIKDLKPENRKKRIEPPKPWGKFERYTVLLALVITVFTAFLLILYSKGFRFPKFNLGEFNLFGEKTILIK